MQDRGFAGLGGVAQIAPQIGQLIGDGAEDAVVVEPGLADGDHAVVNGPVADPLPAGVVDLRGIVRVDAHCGIEPSDAPNQVERTFARGDVPPGNEDAFDPGEPGCADDELEVIAEAVGIEMAVRVDQAHRGMVGGPGTIGS